MNPNLAGVLAEKRLFLMKNKIDLYDSTNTAAIAFGVTVIVGLLVYIAFYK